MVTHNWWHVAVYHLELGRVDRAVELYDAHVWGVEKACTQDQLNAASFLWRMDLLALPTADRWHDVESHMRAWLAKRIYGYNPFTDLHFVYTFARARHVQGDESFDGPLGEIVRGVEEGAHYQRQQRDVAVPVERGIVAFVRGHKDEARSLLGGVLGRLHELGGSDAQRKVFSKTHDCSLIES